MTLCPLSIVFDDDAIISGVSVVVVEFAFNGFSIGVDERSKFSFDICLILLDVETDRQSSGTNIYYL